MRNINQTSSLQRLHPFYFVLPGLLIFLVFFIIPIIASFYLSLTDWNVFSSDIRFVGFQNFIRLFKEGRLLNAFKNTIFFTLTVVIVGNVISFLLALLLTETNAASKFFRALFFFPCVVSIVVWGYLFATILNTNGLLNNILTILLGTNVRIAWLGSTTYSIFIVALVQNWIWTGFRTMIYITSIHAIPREVLDAAQIDGAKGLSLIYKIIIPVIIPGLTVNIVLTIIGGLKVFDIVMVLTKGGPGRATEVFNTLIYEMFSEGYFGVTATANLILIVFIAILALPVYIMLSKKVVEL